MKFTFLFLLLLNIEASSQTISNCLLDMDSTKHVQKMLKLTDIGAKTFMVIPMMDKDNKIQKFVLLNSDIAKSLNIDFYNDTTFASRIHEMLSNPINMSSVNLVLHQYKVHEKIYLELGKYSSCEIYKKYFTEEGFPDNSKFVQYGEFSTVLAYLIDNYAIISSDETAELRVTTKPCCSKNKR